MKTLKTTTYAVLLICISLMMGCGSDDDAGDNNQQGADHTYDITINPGGDNERHVEGTIANLSSDDGTNSNFSVYSNIENGKGVVLRIANSDIVIAGLFLLDDDGNAADLSDDSDNASSLILTFAPPSTDVNNGISGNVNLSNINYALITEAGGAIGYTLTFDGQFEGIDEVFSRIKGTVVVNIPRYL